MDETDPNVKPLMSGAHTATGPRNPVPVQFSNRFLRQFEPLPRILAPSVPASRLRLHQQACLCTGADAFPRCLSCRNCAGARSDAPSLISANARAGPVFPCAACFRETERVRFTLELATALFHSANCRSSILLAWKRAILSRRRRCGLVHPFLVGRYVGPHVRRSQDAHGALLNSEVAQ